MKIKDRDFVALAREFGLRLKPKASHKKGCAK